MRMTTKGQYALVALMNIKKKNLAGKSGPVRIQEIAKEEKLSTHYLEQLFRKLRAAGLATSIRGPGGGYVLATEPETNGASTRYVQKRISYKDVLEAVGESVALRDALKDESPATNDVIENLNSVYTRLTKDLESITI